MVPILTIGAGCASAPIVRQEARIDTRLPVGRISDLTFEGVRFPFRVSLPSADWKFSLTPPDFLSALGYEETGLQETDLFIFQPATRSHLQIDFTPAGARAQFSQKIIGELAEMGLSSLKEEVRNEYGPEVGVTSGPAVPVRLKGVTYAARKMARYEVKGEKREQGWIYGFSEPYQFFLIYLLLGPGGDQDRRDLEAILSSFEYLPVPPQEKRPVPLEEANWEKVREENGGLEVLPEDIKDVRDYYRWGVQSKTKAEEAFRRGAQAEALKSYEASNESLSAIREYLDEDSARFPLFEGEDILFFPNLLLADNYLKMGLILREQGKESRALRYWKRALPFVRRSLRAEQSEWGHQVERELVALDEKSNCYFPSFWVPYRLWYFLFCR